MLKIGCIIIVLVGPFLSSAQNNVYQTNLWGSFVWNHSWTPATVLTVDAGYRSCDDFIKEHRQSLLRLTQVYRFRNGISAGGGLAWFRHRRLADHSINNEIRPFLHVTYRFRQQKWLLNVRFREELRWYPQVENRFFRSRLQFMIMRSVSSWLNPVFSAEGFLTTGKNSLKESRLTCGNQWRFRNKTALYLFYTLQFQSSVNGNQHIIGAQYTINTGANGE